MAAAAAGKASKAGREPRVLSIQSHVVTGYVGNRSATFPLQVLGFEVDAINSVQFSNHTGYPSFTGQKLSAEELWELFSGLERSGLLEQYTHLLTGYVGSAEFLRTVLKIVKRLRDINPELVYVCDPVLGDDGKLYVPADLVPIYRDELVPLADVVAPNAFEVEQLTGCSLTSVSDCQHAAGMLHACGVPKVVFTSFHTGSADISIFGSFRAAGSSSSDAPEAFLIQVPHVEQQFTGTGDLFSALILAWTHLLGGDLAGAVERATATLQAVIVRTFERSAGSSDMRARELALVQSKKDIEEPSIKSPAQPITACACGDAGGF
eukprot:m.491772 g.491772  ORF g.491772 m.491772 type:complete len:322 (-) comp30682_c0_seq1:56-1021(-)